MPCCCALQRTRGVLEVDFDRSDNAGLDDVFRDLLDIFDLHAVNRNPVTADDVKVTKDEMHSN